MLSLRGRCKQSKIETAGRPILGLHTLRKAPCLPASFDSPGIGRPRVLIACIPSRWKAARACLLILAALVVLLVGGCTEKRTPEQLKNSIVFGYGDNFKTFDPTRQIYAQESAIILQVLEPLVRWNQDLQMQGYLATSWETPDHCNSWVFHLRQGVHFHDGTPFNSLAVKKHFERVLDPAVAATRRKLIEDVVSIETPDEYTVVFRLVAPNCIFPEKLTGAFASIPSPDAVAKWGDQFGLHPVGTGPFIFKEWIPDVAIRLEKNPDYWNVENIHLDRLEFRPVRENTTRLILLEQGVLDIADVSYQLVQVAKGADDIVVQSVPQLSIRYVGFNYQKPPFNNKLVRQAANHAVNREDLIKYVFFGVGEPAYGPIPTVLSAYNPNIPKYKYDPALSRKLLEEAGYPKDFTASYWTYEMGMYRDTTEAIVGYLGDVGIKVKMNILDNGVYWDKFDEYLTPGGEMYPTKDGVFDIYVGGWVGGETAHGFLEPLFKSGSTSNASFYLNPEVDRLLVEFKTKEDPAERDEIYKRIQALVVDDAPWIFAFHGQLNMGLRKRVKGFKVNPSNWYFFEGVRVIDDESGGKS